MKLKKDSRIAVLYTKPINIESYTVIIFLSKAMSIIAFNFTFKGAALATALLKYQILGSVKADTLNPYMVSFVLTADM